MRRDAVELGCLEDVERARIICERGTSADRQREVLAAATAEGADAEQALQMVVDHLIEETVRGL